MSPFLMQFLKKLSEKNKLDQKKRIKSVKVMPMRLEMNRRYSQKILCFN